MPTPTNFDVLIVYSERTAYSAAASPTRIKSPFGEHADSAGLNQAYAYFLAYCASQGLTAALTTSSDITGPGECKSYWQYQDKSWQRVNTPAFATQIFDKFSPVNPELKASRKLLFSGKNINSFNNPLLFDDFFDKQKTYNALSAYAIPTVPLVGTSLASVTASCAKLDKLHQAHPTPSDFTQDIVMKDRFGAGGWQVYKLCHNDYAQMFSIQKKNPDISFVIQAFANFSRGFSYAGVKAATDIRFIILHGKITQTFIRIAKKGEFRCNAHQGCSLYYLGLKDIPKKVITRAKQVASVLPEENSLFSLDFISTNSGNVYLLEGNTGPGVTWSETDKIDQRRSKGLIRHIVRSLRDRIVARNQHPKIKSIIKPTLSLAYPEPLYV